MHTFLLIVLFEDVVESQIGGLKCIYNSSIIVGG